MFLHIRQVLGKFEARSPLSDSPDDYPSIPEAYCEAIGLHFLYYTGLWDWLLGLSFGTFPDNESHSDSRPLGRSDVDSKYSGCLQRKYSSRRLQASKGTAARGRTSITESIAMIRRLYAYRHAMIIS